MNTTLILRVDDICATTRPTELERLYGNWWAAGNPVCLSVIPRSAYRFTVTGVTAHDPQPMTANRAMIDFLKPLIEDGLVEVALHGWEHHHGELAGRDAAVIREKLEAGLDLLHETFPAAKIRVLVPPHDYLSLAGVVAAHVLGLTVCSTWAVVHGGARRAHYTGRVRRWLGRSNGQDRHGFNTDAALDFVQRGEVNRITNLRHVNPLVIVQHPWLVLRAAAKWERWLKTELPQFKVQRYADFLDHHHDV